MVAHVALISSAAAAAANVGVPAAVRVRLRHAVMELIRATAAAAEL
jgi:hypothetical protein